MSGLDDVLGGGFTARKAYLVRGGPGHGKTTLGLHFLTAGAREDAPLFITLSESERAVRENAAGLGFDLAEVAFLDLSPTSAFFAKVETYDIFTAAEVEREPLTAAIVAEVERRRPSRVFIDSMTQFRYLSADPYQFRKQILSFLRFLVDGGATVLFTAEASSQAPDDDLQFIADGVVLLDRRGRVRSLEVTKLRGSSFAEGPHSMRLTGTGIVVYPRLVPSEHRRPCRPDTLASGVPALDALLHGGIERGTITLLSGPSGAGKTTVGVQFMKEAAGRGERSVIYTFEEDPEMILARSESLGIPARIMVENGTLEIKRVEPLQYIPDQLAASMREDVEQRNTRLVMFDSVTGFRLYLRGEDYLSHLHAKCKYLQNMGVTVILVAEAVDLTGNVQVTEEGFSYLADNVLLFRYLEARLPNGAVEIRRSIAVLKKRLSSSERTLRELTFTRYGLMVSEPLSGLKTILGETPSFTVEGQGT